WLIVSTCCAGCVSVDEWQRGLAYAPSREIMATPQLESLAFTDQWVESPATDGVAAGLLHGWWIPHSSSDAPAVLYLHGNSGNISSNRNISVIHGLHRAGFAVLAIDYRGYGRSTMALPNESALYADAQAAWERMLILAPHAKKRLIYGHSLGGAVAIDLALTATDLDALVVEGTYTSFAEVVQTTRYGWLPLSLILTQKYASDEKIKNIRVPKLFIHGSSDEIIPVEMGKRLYAISLEPKSLLIVPDGRHRDTAVKAGGEWIKAMRRLAGLGDL
ncbi:MAG: alpha/beta fold hydrolase, partial [Nitrosospira sp.]